MLTSNYKSMLDDDIEIEFKFVNRDTIKKRLSRGASGTAGAIVGAAVGSLFGPVGAIVGSWLGAGLAVKYAKNTKK